MGDPLEQIVAEREVLRARVAELEVENAALRQAGIDGTTAGYDAARNVLDEWSKNTAEMKALADQATQLAGTAIEQRDAVQARLTSALEDLGKYRDLLGARDRDLAATNEILDAYKRTVAEGGPVSTALAEQVGGLKHGLVRLMPLRSLVGDYEWSSLDRHDLQTNDHLAERVVAAFATVERDEKAYREELAAKEQRGG